jgi:hypothetical protein
MTFLDYLSATDPSGALTAKVYAGVLRVFKSMAGDPSFEEEYQKDWQSEPEPMSASAIMHFLSVVSYAPVDQEDTLGSFNPYDPDNMHAPTIRISVHNWTETILHEVAHAVQYVLRGHTDHDDQWKSIATIMGCELASEETD